VQPEVVGIELELAGQAGGDLVFDPGPVVLDVFEQVSCVSASSCTAAGSSGSDTLIESWDGTAWSVVTSPDGPVAPASDNELLGVSCLAASCTAGGGYRSGTNQLTLIESDA
jgi:hypothetical protein